MIQFVKMHGAGNDFVCLDRLTTPSPCSDALAQDQPWPMLAKELCDRNFGVGSDGILVIERGDLAPFRMRMFNPDGTEAEMCGNGTRCVGRFLVETGHAQEGSLDLEVFGRVVHMDIGPEAVSVDMGPATVIERDLDLSFNGYHGALVDVNNPHVVIFVEDVEAVPLAKHGAALEDIQGANVHFVQELAPGELKVRHWERGAGATLACGSGACAVAAAYLPVPGRVLLHVPGGELSVQMTDEGHAIKTGPARTVYSGVWP